MKGTVDLKIEGSTIEAPEKHSTARESQFFFDMLRNKICHVSLTRAMREPVMDEVGPAQESP